MGGGLQTKTPLLARKVVKLVDGAVAVYEYPYQMFIVSFPCLSSFSNYKCDFDFMKDMILIKDDRTKLFVHSSLFVETKRIQCLKLKRTISNQYR